MLIATIVLQVFIYLAVPVAAIQLAKRYKIIEWLSPIVVCYIVGMLMVNTPVIGVHEGTAIAMTEATIPIAMPLILFSSDFKAWLKQSRDVVISFGCAIAAITVAAYLGGTFLDHLAEQFWKAAGMLVGVYTGGTPNLNSIGMALEAPPELVSALNGFDVVVSAVYLLFLLTIAKPLLSMIYPEFPFGESGEEHAFEDEQLDFWGALPDLVKAFGLSVVIVGVSAGLAMGFAYVVKSFFDMPAMKDMPVAVVFLGLTTGGIAASFFEPIRDLEGTYELGDYFILVFSVAMGARTNFAKLLEKGGDLLIFTAFVIGVAILIHYLLTALFRIDVDTVIITSTAAVFGPAFVPVIAEAIGNRKVILSGLTAGLVGYAVGNYIGIGLGTFLAP